MQNYALFFSKPSIIWNMSQIHNANVSFDDLNQRSTSNFLPPKSILASQANEDGLIREKMAVQMVSSGFEDGLRWFKMALKVWRRYWWWLLGDYLPTLVTQPWFYFFKIGDRVDFKITHPGNPDRYKIFFRQSTTLYFPLT